MREQVARIKTSHRVAKQIDLFALDFLFQSLVELLGTLCDMSSTNQTFVNLLILAIDYVTSLPWYPCNDWIYAHDTFENSEYVRPVVNAQSWKDVQTPAIETI